MKWTLLRGGAAARPHKNVEITGAIFVLQLPYHLLGFGWREDSSGESSQASYLEKITLWQARPVNTFLACVTVGIAHVFV